MTSKPIVARLAGALVVSTENDVFLVGMTKAPCDWNAAGFAVPAMINPAPMHTPRDAQTAGAEHDPGESTASGPIVRLERLDPIRALQSLTKDEPYLEVSGEGEMLARAVADRFVISRNGSVSERLWRLVTNPDDSLDPPSRGPIDARWLTDMPLPVWRVVRDTVLRCL